ncbi:MAG: sugar ABC transporter permease [Lachnospiraceae bacterium]|jgi:multiple sugar transport system permease protein/putative aldouronate transport system permease protein|nr:sugar ABC transporter permease [Lachnospiraceae bacterium]MBO7387093.1 sugar ABC transporter permease [Lachnospiraceae bacterium]MBP5297673.1 sugar ABC transporter permease [Lachnospiraceae bacterium]SDA68191.1 multiple sugar transport system permease protein [Lachnospiraceae bacterium G11]
MRKEFKKNRELYLMCVPALLVLLAFAYIPMAGIWMAFTKYNIKDGIFGSEFVGLQNFKYFFTSSTGMGPKVIKNTLVINFWGLIFGTILPITIAICFNEVRGKIFKKVTQSAMFFPYFLSWVVVGAIVYAFFSTDTGMVNRMLANGGHDIVRWYAEKKYWKPIIITADVWKWAGYNSIIYMAAMTNFDASLYDAASVDGANRFQQILHITLPLIKPTVVVLSLMSIGRIFFGDFGMIYGIVGNNSLLYEEVAVIDTYVYSAMRSLGFSYTTAIGLFQSVMGLILVTLSNKLAKKVNEGEGLF